jgi:hypothetical protein
MRRPTLVFLALLMAAAAVAVHADAATMHFDIKAQPLSEALMAFGAQTGAIVMASSGTIRRPAPVPDGRWLAATRQTPLAQPTLDHPHLDWTYARSSLVVLR